MILQILSIVGVGLLGGIFLFLFPFLLIKLMLILLFISIFFRRGFGYLRARRYYGGRYAGRIHAGRYHAGRIHAGHPYDYHAEDEFHDRRFFDRFNSPARREVFEERETLQDISINRQPIAI